MGSMSILERLSLSNTYKHMQPSNIDATHSKKVQLLTASYMLVYENGSDELDRTRARLRALAKKGHNSILKVGVRGWN